MSNVRFTLYVTGRTVRSERAIENLRGICKDVLDGEYELTVVDVLEQPEVAEEKRLLATPTLVKEFPPPTRTLVGDLSNRKAVLNALGLDGDSKHENL